MSPIPPRNIKEDEDTKMIPKLSISHIRLVIISSSPRGNGISNNNNKLGAKNAI